MIPNEILNYTIIRQIGLGGMGQVFLAKNKNIEQFVAIKSLHPKYANNTLLRERFKQEAQMLSSLDHPNIVKFLNYVENENGVFLIMEYVEGVTLDEFINNKNGLIVEKRAYPLMCQILDAFSYAHSRGIVHRDIKPSNIFITDDGNIKVMDFGIAQILSEVDGHAQGGTDGTIEYMSPEQVQGKPVDQRSDIYSLGVLFHHMLTGRMPYNATTMSRFEIMQNVVDRPLPRLKEFYPYTSDGMQRIVDKAVSKDPESRYKDCAEIKRDVRNVIEPERRNMLPIYIGIGLVAIVAAAAFWLWDYNRTKVTYYKDYAEYFGVPQGIGKISSSDVSHRSQSYRIEKSKGKVRRLTLVNAYDKPIGHSDTETMNMRVSDTEYFYTDDGKIDYKKMYDQYGKLLYKLDYDENLKTATFKYDDEYGTAARLKASTTNNYSDVGSIIPEKSHITRYLLDFDPETGLLMNMYYASGENNDRIGDTDNIYGFTYEYDDKGRIRTTKFLGQDGKVRGNKFGLAYKTFQYDKDDNWINVSYFAADGSPSHDGNNCSVVDISYDQWGNRLGERYLTTDKKPSMRTDTGNFGFDYEYDDHGNRIRQTSVDGDGTSMTNLYGYATEINKYNDMGFLVEQRYLDTNDDPVNFIQDGNAYAIIKVVPDDRGLVTELSYYNTADEPVELSDGAHKRVCDYDSVGNLTRITTLNANNEPTLKGGYFATITRQYDEFNRMVNEAYYDVEGKPTLDDYGIARLEVQYDRQGNLSKMSYYDAEGKKTRMMYGYANIDYKYDEIGNNTTIEYTDQADKPCLNSNGVYKEEYVYDPKTNFIVEIRNYTIDKLNQKIIREYDPNGNITKEYTTNASGVLLSGTAVENNEYDINNRRVKTWASDLKGNKINTPGCKYSIMTFEYDNHGNQTNISFYDKDGKPAADYDGTHQRIHKYDEANRLVYEKNLDTNLKPTKGSKASPEGRLTYDDRGNVTEIIALDGYGKPALCADGYHKLTRTYDSRNNILTAEYTNVDGKLTECRSVGYAKVVNSYNDKGHLVSSKYYTPANKLLFEERHTLNDRNYTTCVLFLNENGKQSDGKRGFSKLTTEYESNNIVPVKQKAYMANGQLLATRKFNSRTNSWSDWTMANNGASINTSGMYNDWRKALIEMAGQCPIKISDELTVTKIKMGANNVEMSFKVNMDQPTIESESATVRETFNQFKQYMHSEVSIPSNISIDIYVYDKDNKFVMII